MLGFSFGLPRPWARILVGGQILFYALAAVDLAVPEKSAVKRVTTPIRTVVTLLAAAALAVSVFFVPPHRLWKVRRRGSAPELHDHILGKWQATYKPE